MKVKFSPIDKEFDIEPNQSVLDLAQKNGVFIKTICNGNASCAECRVKIIDGEQNVLPPTSKELALVGTGYFIDQRRLACQLRCFGDVTIDLKEQLDRKDAGPKRILGNRKMEEDSHAVSEMIMKEDQELVEKVEARVQRQEQQKKKHHKGGGKNNKNRGRGGRNRNRNRRGKGGNKSGGGKPQSGGSN